MNPLVAGPQGTPKSSYQLPSGPMRTKLTCMKAKKMPRSYTYYCYFFMTWSANPKPEAIGHTVVTTVRHTQGVCSRARPSLDSSQHQGALTVDLVERPSLRAPNKTASCIDMIIMMLLRHHSPKQQPALLATSSTMKASRLGCIHVVYLYARNDGHCKGFLQPEVYSYIHRRAFRSTRGAPCAPA